MGQFQTIAGISKLRDREFVLVDVRFVSQRCRNRPAHSITEPETGVRKNESGDTRCAAAIRYPIV
jgi:precorrin isomerase